MSPSRFVFQVPVTMVPCVSCGMSLITELDSPEPHRCALCVIRLAPTPSTSGKTARRRRAA